MSRVRVPEGAPNEESSTETEDSFFVVEKIDTLIISGYRQNQGVGIKRPDSTLNKWRSTDMKGKRIIASAAIRPALSFAFDEFQAKNQARNLSPATIKGYGDTFNRFTSFAKKSILVTP